MARRTSVDAGCEAPRVRDEPAGMKYLHMHQKYATTYYLQVRTYARYALSVRRCGGLVIHASWTSRRNPSSRPAQLRGTTATANTARFGARTCQQNERGRRKREALSSIPLHFEDDMGWWTGGHALIGTVRTAGKRLDLNCRSELQKEAGSQPLDCQGRGHVICATSIGL
ncbi:hypothetical protein V8C26DRAFT_194679 [Trichoderma gracile]